MFGVSLSTRNTHNDKSNNALATETPRNGRRMVGPKHMVKFVIYATSPATGKRFRIRAYEDPGIAVRMRERGEENPLWDGWKFTIEEES